MKLIVLAGLIVGVLLISQVSSGASSTSMMEAGGCPELKSMKPEDFKPEMVVGRFYVENRDDPAAQTLLAESKKVKMRSSYLFDIRFSTMTSSLKSPVSSPRACLSQW